MPTAGPEPTDPAVGLTSAEVADRLALGLGNTVGDDGRRRVGDIVRANLFTRFNAILGSLLVIVLLTREYRDALFGIVLVANTLVGTVQELRAKATLDRLNLVSAPRIRVRRDGTTRAVPVSELVRDDVVEVVAGDQLPVDAEVLRSAGLEVDESLLSGESDPVHLASGDRALSGSFVVSGSGLLLVTAVGDEAYAARLAAEARRFAAVRSELREGTDQILRVGTWALIPAGVLLAASQVRTTASLPDAVRSSIAGVAAMVPEGLVLLTSVAFAAGVLRLGRRQALVQELAGVEVLARVDVVCVDKTGTLTTGALELSSVEPAAGAPAGDAHAALGALARADPHANTTLRAVAAGAPDPGWIVEHAVAFSSARKWSGASFGSEGTWVLGAPEVLLPTGHPAGARVEALARGGARVVLLARTAAELTPGLAEVRPSPIEPVAIVGLAEQVRPEAAATLAYFAREGVAVVVISGDHPRTVAAVAAAVGVSGADAPVDARSLPDDPGALAEAMEQASVFGRVQPHQKRAMVEALQARGHVVAMTGDGVNDVLALKRADLGVAMGSGSGATRAVAQVVLLDDSFASLPAVVAEGRRVIANIERVANLFVTKSVYAAVLAIAVGIVGVPFPFYPRHLTIISTLTIGIPAFFLALAPNERRWRPGFVRRVARFALPAGAIAAAATFGGYALAAAQPHLSLVEERTSAVVVLFGVAMAVLVDLSRPLAGARLLLIASMVGAFVATLAVPASRRFFELQLPPPGFTAVVLAIAAVAGTAVLLTSRWTLPGDGPAP